MILGFGSIGQGVLPLLLRHIEMQPSQISVIAADPRGKDIAIRHGAEMRCARLTRENYATVLEPLIGPGDFLLNLSVDVSSVALLALAHARGAHYLDTCIEPWAGGYTDPSLTPAQRSNYALRQSALALGLHDGPTAVITHGANPGLVSHFVKQALLNIAADTDVPTNVPSEQPGWAALAARLNVKVIHIAERDTQTGGAPKQPGEFVNTWSIDGFVSEACQPAELGWGTHEKSLPVDGRRHDTGPDCAIYLLQPGAATRVRSWTPMAGPQHAFLVTHNESISIADYFTLRMAGKVHYRPTVHYAYCPCDGAILSLHEFAGQNWAPQPRQRLLVDEIENGSDELGVLLMGHARGAYWFGSRLSIAQTRAAAPHNNATSLQVTVSVLGGVIWALENPDRGIVEPDEMDHARLLEICTPYLGDVVGAYTDWTPLQNRGRLFPETVDTSCPWQFGNFRVV